MAIDDTEFQQQRMGNLLQAGVMLLTMLGLVVLVGYLMGIGLPGAVLIGIAAAVGLAMTRFASPSAVMRMHKARPLYRNWYPNLYAVLEELAERAGLPQPPELYLLPTPVHNAFTMGQPNNAAIALSQGLLTNFTEREIRGVLAHEIAHIAGRDTTVMAMADMATRITVTMAQIGIILLLLQLPIMLVREAPFPWLLLIALWFSPTISGMMQLALSRNREYHADLNAAKLCGDPYGLASAIRKIDRQQRNLIRLLTGGRREPASPSTLRTHPDPEDRIKRLLELAERDDLPTWGVPSEARQSRRETVDYADATQAMGLQGYIPVYERFGQSPRWVRIRDGR